MLLETPEEFIFMNLGHNTNCAIDALREYSNLRRYGSSELDALNRVEEIYGVAPYIFPLAIVQKIEV